MITFTQFRNSKLIIVFALLFGIQIKGLCVGITDVDPNNDGIALSFNPRGQQYNNFMRYNCSEEERLVASLKAGETLNFGFQFQYGELNALNNLTGDVWVRVKSAANDAIVFGPVEITQGNAGYINNTGEAAGPKTIQAGGYTPQTYTATITGDYYIEIGYNTGANGDIDNFAATGSSTFIAPLYDVTVTNTANEEQFGRVWSKAWQIFVISGWAGELETKQYIYTDDGLISELDYNGMSPYQYILVSNSTGSLSTGDLFGDRRSINSPFGSELIPEYRLFFDLPDTTIFQLADLDLLFGDLNKDIEIQGCPGNYCINIDVNRESFARLLIDLNGTNGYQENTSDILLEVELNQGENCVSWDGLDGEGNIVQNAGITIDIEFVAGITHLPKYDVEYNSRGLKVNFLYPQEIAKSAEIYWDDTGLGGTSNTLSGCINNCHTWTNPAYGDVKIINSWWYVTKDAIKSSIQIEPVALDAGSDINVCPEGSTTLSPSTGFSSYSWTPISSVSNPNIASPVASGEYDGYFVLTATDANGCTYKDSLLSSPFDPAQVIGNNTEICLGESSTISVSSSGTYNWSNGLGTGATKTVSPTTNTTYQIIGTDNNGCKDTLNLNVTVNNLPNISIDGSDVCFGQSSTLTASGASNYVWDNGLGSTPSISVSPTTQTVYSVTGTDGNNCSNTDTYTVSILSNPNLTVSGSDVCLGDITTLTASGAQTYLWDNSLGNGNSKTVFPTNSTIYKVIGTGSNGCIDSAAVTIDILSKPTVVADSINICPKDEATLSASGASEYIWLNNNANTSNIVVPTINARYQVVGTNNDGCKDTAFAYVNVYTSPTIVAENDTICVGEVATLSAKGGVSYLWNNLSTGENYSSSPTSTDTITLEGTDINGCSSTITANVVVFSLPDISITGNAICQGESVQLKATGATTYSWTNSHSYDTMTVAPSINTVYAVTGTNDNGCSIEGSYEVNVINYPIVLISSPKSTICSGESLRITASGANNYEWLDNGNTNPYQSISPETSTSYTVIGFNSQCTDTASLYIEVNPLPNITAYGAEVCPGESAILHAEGAETYEWDGIGFGSDFLTAPEYTSDYTVYATDSNGCQGSASTTIIVKEIPNIDVWLSVNEKILLGESVTVTPITNANNISLEDLPIGTILYSGAPDPIYLVPDSSTSYLLEGTLEQCLNQDEFDVEVVELIKVPSMITPNGDDLNDYWIIDHIEDFPEAEVTLYNRWGNIVLRTTNYAQEFEGKFNGEDLPTAVYYYIIKLNYRDYIYKGSLTIMR